MLLIITYIHTMIITAHYHVFKPNYFLSDLVKENEINDGCGPQLAVGGELKKKNNPDEVKEKEVDHSIKIDYN